MRLAFGIFLILLFSTNSFSQISVGPEIQVYPTGVIPGLRIEKNLHEKSSISLRLGYQWIRHRDLGVHEDERGNGYGISLAFRRFFASTEKGLSLSIRTDLWLNSLDWKDNIGSVDEESGHTDIKVLQPTLVMENAFRLSKKWSIIPSLGVGYEWNISTDGEPTGEGAILLIGVSIMRSL